MSNLGLQMSPRSDAPQGPRHRGMAWLAILLSLGVLAGIGVVVKVGLDNLPSIGGGAADYEGRLGISPREVRTVLLDAAQSAEHACLSPFAVLAEIDEICKRQAEFDWLKEKQLAGGYHDHRLFREVVRRRLLDTLEEEMRAASGLVELRPHRAARSPGGR